MASLCLLTAEEAKNNLALFKSSRNKAICNASTTTIALEKLQAGKIVFLNTNAIALNVPGKSPDNLSYFKIPVYHLHVLSTFVATMMKASDYVPNSGSASKDEEREAFIKFLGSMLHKLPQYIAFDSAPTQTTTENLAKDLRLHLGDAHDVKGLVSKVSKQYVVLQYTFVGSEINPSLLINYVAFNTNGDVSVVPYKLTLLSASVVADAENFRNAKVTLVDDLVLYINSPK